MKNELYDKIRDLTSSEELKKITSSPTLLENEKFQKWADSDKLNFALEKIFPEEQYHVISPASFLISPSDDGDIRGVVEFQKLLKGFIEKDGGKLSQPVISIWNTDSVQHYKEAAQGNHWQTIVIIPKNYNNLGNEHELVLFKDSLHPGRHVPYAIQYLLKDEFSCHEFKDKEAELTLGSVLPNSIIVDDSTSTDKIQQKGGYDCGWWALSNAIMLVTEGNYNFLSEATPSRENGVALRLIFEDAGFDLSEKTKIEEERAAAPQKPSSTNGYADKTDSDYNMLFRNHLIGELNDHKDVSDINLSIGSLSELVIRIKQGESCEAVIASLKEISAAPAQHELMEVDQHNAFEDSSVVKIYSIDSRQSQLEESQHKEFQNSLILLKGDKQFTDSIQNFRKFIDKSAVYVDKTMLVKDVIDHGGHLLLTCPRRWGKSLNLSMIKAFLEPEINHETGQVRQLRTYDYIFNGKTNQDIAKSKIHEEGNLSGKLIRELMLQNDQSADYTIEDDNDAYKALEDFIGVTDEKWIGTKYGSDDGIEWKLIKDKDQKFKEIKNLKDIIRQKKERNGDVGGDLLSGIKELYETRGELLSNFKNIDVDDLLKEKSQKIKGVFSKSKIISNTKDVLILNDEIIKNFKGKIKEIDDEINDQRKKIVKPTSAKKFLKEEKEQNKAVNQEIERLKTQKNDLNKAFNEVIDHKFNLLVKDQQKQLSEHFGFCDKYMGKYPVIYLDLKTLAHDIQKAVDHLKSNRNELLDNKSDEKVDGIEVINNKINALETPNSIDQFNKNLRAALSKAYGEHNYIWDWLAKKTKSEKGRITETAQTNLTIFKAYYHGHETYEDERGIHKETPLSESITFLAKQLHEFFGRKVFVLIDEYDRAVNKVLEHNFFAECQEDSAKSLMKLIINQISFLLEPIAKSEQDYIQQIILTGITNCLLKEGHSALNNISEYGVLDTTYSGSNFAKYFGFSEVELKDQIFDKIFQEEFLKGKGDLGSSYELLFSQLKYWYNGQVIGQEEIFTPSSIIQYFRDLSLHKFNESTSSVMVFKNYWSETGFSNVLKNISRIGISKKLLDKLNDIAINDSSNKEGVDLSDFTEEGSNIYDLIRENIPTNKLAVYLLIKSGYLSRIAGVRSHLFKLPAREVNKSFISDVLKYWVEDRFDGYSASQFIREYIDNINDGEKIEKLLNNVLLKSKAGTKEDAEADFQSLLNGAGKIYDIFHRDEDMLVRSEYQSFNGNRIDGLMAPCNGQGTVVIHEYKKADGDKDKPVFLKLRESISQPFEQGYLISVFKKIDALGTSVTGYANYLGDHDANWDSIIVRGLVFSYQGNKEHYNKSTWQVLVKEVILGTDTAKQIVGETCSINTEAKEDEKSADKANRIKKDGLNRIKKVSSLIIHEEHSDIYQIFGGKNHRGHSSLSKEKEFIDSFVETLNDNIIGGASYQTRQRLKEFMFCVNGTLTKEEFKNRLQELKHRGNGRSVFQDQQIDSIVSEWDKYTWVNGAGIKDRLMCKADDRFFILNEIQSTDESKIEKALKNADVYINKAAESNVVRSKIKSDFLTNKNKYQSAKSIQNALSDLKSDSRKAFKNLGPERIGSIASSLHNELNKNGGLIDIETDASLPLSDSQIKEILTFIREEFLGRRSDESDEFYIPQSRVRDQEEVILTSDNIALELGYWINNYKGKLFLGIAKLVNKEPGTDHIVLLKGTKISDKETKQDKIEIVINDPLSKDSEVLRLYEESGEKLITQMESLKDSHRVDVDVKDINFLGIQEKGESNCAKIAIAQLRAQLESYVEISSLLKEKASNFQSSTALIVDKVQNLAKIHETLKYFHEQDEFKSFLSIVKLTNSQGDARNLLLHGTKPIESSQRTDKVSILDPLGEESDNFYQERLQLLDVVDPEITQHKNNIVFLNLNFHYAYELNDVQLVDKLLASFVRFHKDRELSANFASQLNISTSRKRKFHEIENDNPDDWLSHLNPRELLAKRVPKNASISQSATNEDRIGDMNGETSNSRLHGYKIKAANSLLRHLFKGDNFTQIVKRLDELHDVFVQHKNLYLVNPECIKSEFNKELINFISNNKGVVIAGDLQKDHSSCFDHSVILLTMISRKLSELKIDHSLYRIGVFYTKNEHGRHANIFLSTDLDQQFVEDKLILPAIKYYASSTGIDSNSPHILRSVEDFRLLKLTDSLQDTIISSDLDKNSSLQQEIQSLDNKLSNIEQEMRDIGYDPIRKSGFIKIGSKEDIALQKLEQSHSVISSSRTDLREQLQWQNQRLEENEYKEFNSLKHNSDFEISFNGDCSMSLNTPQQHSCVFQVSDQIPNGEISASDIDKEKINAQIQHDASGRPLFGISQNTIDSGLAYVDNGNPASNFLTRASTSHQIQPLPVYSVIGNNNLHVANLLNINDANLIGASFLNALGIRSAMILVKEGIIPEEIFRAGTSKASFQENTEEKSLYGSIQKQDDAQIGGGMLLDEQNTNKVPLSNKQYQKFKADFLKMVSEAGELTIDVDGVLNQEEFVKKYEKKLSEYIADKKKTLAEKTLSYIDKVNSFAIIVDESLKLVNLANKNELTVKDEIYGIVGFIKIENALHSLSAGKLGFSYTFGLGVDAIAEGVYFGYSAFQNNHSEFITARSKFLTSLNYSVATSMSHGTTLSTTAALGIPLLGKVAIVTHGTSYTTGLLKSYTHSWIGEGGYADYCVTGLDNTVKTIAQPIIFTTEVISVPIASIQGELGWLSEDTRFQNNIRGLELGKTLHNLFSWVTPKFIYDFEQDSKWYQNKIDKANELESYKRHFAKANTQKLYDGIYKPAFEKKYALINSGTSAEDAKKWMESKFKTSVTVKAPEVGNYSEDSKKYLYKYDVCFEVNSYEHGKLYHCYSKSNNSVDSVYSASQYNQSEVIDGYVEYKDIHLEM